MTSIQRIDDSTSIRLAARPKRDLPAWAPEWPGDGAVADLTDKQRRFISEYLIDYNGRRAAQRAGYSGNEDTLSGMAWKNLRHPVIGPAIRHLGAATPEELGITREYVMTKIREVSEKAADSTPSAAMRGLELMSRLRGDLVERADVNVKQISVNINGTGMEDLT